jgi:hypothetical protein
VTSSIEAIQYNDLTELQNSVARQEALCRELTAAQLPPLGAHSQSRFGHEIRSAHIELAQQNRLYKAVLKRARKSVGLILAVYQHHGRGYSKDGTSRTDNHTWSCEV